MRIELRTRGLGITDALRDHVVRRLDFALRRFGSEIDGVVGRLEDVNGPRGGRDKRCQLTITGPRIGGLSFRAQGDDVYAAVAVLAERGARGAHRERERRRELHAGDTRTARRAS